MAKKRVKRIRVPRTRNHASMTEAAFWSWIRSCLRKRSQAWKPLAEARRRSRRVYRGTNKRQKWEYQCACCKKYFKGDQVVVDHIIPAGSLKCAADLPGFVERLFCEVDRLQVLCNPCHDKKTKADRLKKK